MTAHESVKIDWHPLAWELALTSKLSPCEDGEQVCASVSLHSDNEIVRACGHTTNQATQALARKLTHFYNVGAFEVSEDMYPRSGTRFHE
jgi:hypothetical protein